MKTLFTKTTLMMGGAVFMALLSSQTASAQFHEWLGEQMEIVVENDFRITEIPINELPVPINIENIQQLNEGISLASETQTTATRIWTELDGVITEAEAMQITGNLTAEENAQVEILKTRATWTRNMAGEFEAEAGTILTALLLLHEAVEHAIEISEEANHDAEWMVRESDEAAMDLLDTIPNYIQYGQCAAFAWFHFGPGHGIINHMNTIADAGFIFYEDLTNELLGTDISFMGRFVDLLSNGNPVEQIHNITLDTINTVGSLLDEIGSAPFECYFIDPNETF